MKYHLVINNTCNLFCKYCQEIAFDNRLEEIDFPTIDENIPERINFSINELISFLSKDKNPYLIFYGGEPLLSSDKIEEIIKQINFPCKFAIQTNGTLLDKLSSKALHKISVILISIDGNKKITDNFRGNGTYLKIMNNIKSIIKNGYSGKIIARMTLMEPNKTYESINYLLNNKDYSFKEIHWQLNANFYPDSTFREFKTWSKEYLKDIEKLIDNWINNMKTGKVIMLYPFVGIIKRIMELEEKSDFKGYYLPCGSGHSNYSIQSNGIITPCPIMIGMINYYQGDIFKDTEKSLKKKMINVSGVCLNCDYLKVCGGRCLYSNIVKPWNKENTECLCFITKKTIDLLKVRLPEIKTLIKEKKISKTDFEYEKYIGPEIIP